MCTTARPAIQKIVQGRSSAGARHALQERRAKSAGKRTAQERHWRAVTAPLGSAFADVRHTLATKILRIGYNIHVILKLVFLLYGVITECYYCFTKFASFDKSNEDHILFM